MSVDNDNKNTKNHLDSHNLQESTNKNDTKVAENKEPLRTLVLKKLDDTPLFSDIAGVTNSQINNNPTHTTALNQESSKTNAKDVDISEDAMFNFNMVSTKNDSAEPIALDILKQPSPTLEQPNTSVEQIPNKVKIENKPFIENEVYADATQQQSANNQPVSTNNAENATAESNDSLLSRKEKYDNLAKNRAKNNENFSQAFAKINPKKMVKQNDSEEELTYEEKIDKTLNSIAHLFEPFKTILVSILPKTQGLINKINWFGSFIAKIIKFIALLFPKVIHVIRSGYFTTVVIIILILFALGPIASRLLNTPAYINNLEDSIYKSTGYKVDINGTISFSLFPSLAISLNNVNFYTDTGNNSNDFMLSQLNTNILKIQFKILPLFLGNFSIDRIILQSAVLDVKTSTKHVLDNNVDYDVMMQKVENAIKSKLNNNIKQDIEKLYNQSDNVETPKDNLATLKSLIQSDKNNIPQESKEAVQDNKEPYLDLDLDNKVAPLVNTPPAKVSVNNSLMDNMFAVILKNMVFSLKNIDTITLTKSKINLVNIDDQVLMNINNINGKLSTSFTGKTYSSGSFRFMDSNILYDINLKYSPSKTDMLLKLSFEDSLEQGFTIEAQRDIKTNMIQGNIVDHNSAVLHVVDKFIMPIDFKHIKQSDFNSKFILNSSYLALTNIALVIDDEKYSGNFNWIYKDIENSSVSINMNAEIADITPHFNAYMKYLSTSSAKNSEFISLVETTSRWKIKTINNFQVDNFRVSLNLKDTKFHDSKVDNININFLINSDNKVYIDKFDVMKGDTEIKLLGKIDLDGKSGLLAVQSSGKIEMATNLFNWHKHSDKFLHLLAGNNNSYQIQGKFILDNNHFVINEIMGNLGNLKIDNTYAILLERTGSKELLINSKLNSLDVEYLKNSYRNQFDGLEYQSGKGINVFGLPKSMHIKLNLNVDTMQYHKLHLKDSLLEIDLLNSGFLVKKAMGYSDHGGSFVASFNIDTDVKPVVAGHINFNDFVVKAEELDDLMFNKNKVIGNVSLTGKLRFSGDDYNTPFNDIEGDLTLIKYERLKLNRFANADGLYMTLSTKSKQPNTYFINDLYGRVKIVNSSFEFYPVSILYLQDSKEYRGTFHGLYNFRENTLDATGSVDQVENINNKIEFSVKGLLTNPSITSKTIKSKTSSRVKMPKVKIPPSIHGSKTHKVVNALNDTTKKEHFNNSYNLNVDSSTEKQTKDKLYNKDVSAADDSVNTANSDFKTRYSSNRKNAETIDPMEQ